MRCDHLEPLIELIADSSYEPGAEDAEHLAGCAVCASRLSSARTIESMLGTREMAAPSSSFTGSVMARVGQERWKTERVVDLGFNLAIAAGVLVILAAGSGLAWSLGLVTVTIDLDAMWLAFGADVAGRAVAGANDRDGGALAHHDIGVVVVGRDCRGLAATMTA